MTKVVTTFYAVPGKCKYCGNPFAGRPDRKFCSRVCVNLAQTAPTSSSAGRHGVGVVVDHFKWRHDPEYRAHHAGAIAETLAPTAVSCVWRHRGDCCDEGEFDDRKIL